jgi:hypothetical protein
MQPDDNGRDSGNPAREADRQHRRRTRKSNDGRRYHKGTRYVLIPGVIVLLLVLLAYFFRRPVTTRLRAWKSDKVIEEAESEYRAHRYTEVHRKLQVALQLAPLNPKVQRLAARFYTEVNIPDSLNHWQLVISAPNASIEDKLAYVDACLKFLRADLASAELNSMEPTISKSPDFLRRVVRYLILVGDFSGAVPYAREAQVINPRDEEFEFLLGLSLLRAARPDWVQEGRRLLMGISLVSGAQQLPAARELIATGALTAAEGRQIARALERRTDLQFSDRLEIAGLRMGVDRTERERVAQSLIAELPPKDDAERLTFAGWTLRMQLPQVAKAFLASLNTTNQALVTLRAEALALDADWDGLSQVLERDSSLIMPATLAGAKALRARAKGDQDQVIAIFSSAMDSITSSSARTSADQLVVLSTWAERMGQTNLAMKALQPLLQVRSVLPSAGRRILTLSAGVESLELTLPALRALRGYAPNDRGVQNAFAHVALLLNENVDEAAAASAELLTVAPSSSPARVLAAFGRFRLGKSTEALELLEEGGMDIKTLDPRLKALVAVIWHSAGQRDSARQLAREIAPDTLKLEERRLLEALQ